MFNHDGPISIPPDYEHPGPDKLGIALDRKKIGKMRIKLALQFIDMMGAGTFNSFLIGLSAIKGGNVAAETVTGLTSPFRKFIDRPLGLLEAGLLLYFAGVSAIDLATETWNHIFPPPCSGCVPLATTYNEPPVYKEKPDSSLICLPVTENSAASVDEKFDQLSSLGKAFEKPDNYVLATQPAADPQHYKYYVIGDTTPDPSKFLEEKFAGACEEVPTDSLPGGLSPGIAWMVNGLASGTADPTATPIR